MPDLHAELKPLLKHLINDEPVDGEGLTETTFGRALVNTAFPTGFPFVNAVLLKCDIRTSSKRSSTTYDKPDVANTLDCDQGTRVPLRNGRRVSRLDSRMSRRPPEKKQILAKFEDQAAKVESQYQKGIITDDERRSELIEIWTVATDEVKDAMQETLQADPFNPMDMMVRSGARGNIMQLRQIAGMRGLVANPKGDIIPQPIRRTSVRG